MPARIEGLLVVNDLTGGRNLVDAPLSPQFGQTQAREMLNVDFYQTTFGRKRNGLSTITLTFGAGGPFTSNISSIYRHIPAAVETAAEIWMVDAAATNVIGRKTAGSTFTAPTLKDAPTGNGWDYSFVTANTKLYIAYQSAQNRMHVWDGSTVRRTGLISGTTAPTVANTGAGSYAAVLRYYRIRWTEQVASATVRRSEATNSVSFTPSGSGTAARITQPTVLSEGETHWEVEASIDNTTFFLLSTVVVGTTTYDDSAATTTYASGTASAITGTYSHYGYHKFIVGDSNRLLLMGSYSAGDPQNRVFFTPPNGSGVGDLERLDTSRTYYVDLDEQDSGDPTGFEGPVLGNIYAFKVKQVWELRPTGDVNQPYQRSPISKTVGAVAPRAHCIGEDASGRPCLYFMSHRGVYRYGVGGLTYIGRGIDDLVSGSDFTGFTNRINLSARVPCHMVYHADRGQLWVWWATGTSTTADPSRCAVWHVAHGCWTYYESGIIERARCSAMIPRTLGASSARDLKPATGDWGANNTALLCDDTNATQDNSTSFQAEITLKLYSPWGLGFRGYVGDARLLASNLTGVTITMRTYREGVQSDYVQSTALLTQTSSDAWASRLMEGSATQGSEFVQFAIGEFAAANTASWTLHALTIPWWREEANVG